MIQKFFRKSLFGFFLGFSCLLSFQDVEAAILTIRPNWNDDLSDKTRNPELAYDSSTESYSQTKTGSNERPSIIFGFDGILDSEIDFQSLNLLVDSESIGHSNDRWRIRYSLNGGRRWFDIFSFNSNNKKREISKIELDPKQKINDLQIGIETDRRGGDDGGIINLYNVWIEGEYVSVNPQTRLNQVGFGFYENLNQGLFFGNSGVIEGDSLENKAEWIKTLNQENNFLVIGGIKDDGLRIEKRDLVEGVLVENFGINGSMNLIDKEVTFKGAGLSEESLMVATQEEDGEVVVYKVDSKKGELIEDFGEKGIIGNYGRDLEVYDLFVLEEDLFIFGEGLAHRWMLVKADISSGELVGNFGQGGIIRSGGESKYLRSVSFFASQMILAGSGKKDNWRIEKRDLSSGELFTKALAQIGSPLTSQNNRLISNVVDFNFRLQLGILVEKQDLSLMDGVFKLQFAQKKELSCANEKYQDIGRYTKVYFFENANLDSGDLMILAENLSFGPKVISQNYYQSQPFLNNASGVKSGEIGIWDFSLGVQSASSGEVFCLRAVMGDGSQFDNYQNFPEIIIASDEFRELVLLDDKGQEVNNLKIAFPSINFDWKKQETKKIIGSGLGGIQVLNYGNNPFWSLSLAARDGPEANWQGGSESYSYNESEKKGRLAIELSSVEIIPSNNCDLQGLTLGSSSYFEKDLIDSITLLSAGDLADLNCNWLIKEVELKQEIPPGQKPQEYGISLVLTLI